MPVSDVRKAQPRSRVLRVLLERLLEEARGPIEIEYDWETCRLRMPSELDGEIAVLDALLEAFGEDSFAALDAQVLSIEDTLSTVTAVGTLTTG